MGKYQKSDSSENDGLSKSGASKNDLHKRIHPRPQKNPSNY